MNINTSHWQTWSLGLPWPPGQPWPSGPHWQPGPPGAPGAPWLTNHLDQLNHSGNPEGWKYLSGRKKQKSHFLIGLVLVRIFFLLVTLFCYTLNQALLFEKTCVDYSIRIICWITYCFLKPFAAADEWNWAHCLRQIRKGEKAMHKVQVLQGANIALARNIKSPKVQPERTEVWKLCATNPKSLPSLFD